MAGFASVSNERVQAFWDARPCNIAHSPSPVGTKQYFDEVEARKYLVEPHIPRFANFEQWTGKRVLEIGCGLGTDTMNFARAGARVTAVDISARSLGLAAERARVYDLDDRITFCHGDAESLSRIVPSEPYDLVYSFGVLHHTPHPERVIDEIARHFVHPGSVLKLMFYHRWSYKVAWILLTQGRGRIWRLDELIARYSEAQTGCPVTYTYSRRQARRLLGDCFKVRDMAVEHIFPYRIPDYVQHRYVKALHFRLMPHGLFRWLERHAGWHLCITAAAR